jgi:hypothetical protein
MVLGARVDEREKERYIEQICGDWDSGMRKGREMRQLLQSRGIA